MHINCHMGHVNAPTKAPNHDPWDLTSTQREHVHGEMIPPTTSMEGWSHPGESRCMGKESPNHDPWDLTSTQREHVHGEMIPPTTSMEGWSHPGESRCMGKESPNHARGEIFPNRIPSESLTYPS